MSTVVLVPRRSDGAERDRIWEHVRGVWTQTCPGVPIVEGHHDDGPLNRSAARNRAAELAGDWTVAIFADADTLVPATQVREACRLARRSGDLVFPFDRYRALTPRATANRLRGRDDDQAKWTMRRSVGGALVIRRDLWDDVGGYDERFVGWGYEDRAFAIACETLKGLRRVSGSVRHLWHPISPERDPELPDYQAGRALARRYKTAAGDPVAIRKILAERSPA